MKNLLFIITLFLSITVIAQNESYQKLQTSLKAFSNNPNITVFIGTDYNFSATSFSSYLQTELNLSSKEFKYGKKLITETFVPKASKDNQFIKINYYVSSRTDIIGYADVPTVSVVNSVKISGSAKLMAKLFLNYWPNTHAIKKTGNQNMATKELLSDFITMQLLPNNLAEIIVKKGISVVDYQIAYGINKPKSKG